MEKAVRTLAAAYPRVLVRNKTSLFRPLRFRRSQIADLNPYICLAPKAFDAQVTAWNQEGGILVYDRSYRIREDLAAHQAQIIIECPPSLEDLKAYIASAREAAVVYLPPNWEAHERAIHYNFPPAAVCRRFYEEAQRGVGYEEIGEAAGIKERFTAVTDERMKAALKLSEPQLWRIRNTMLRDREWKMVTRVVPRIEPEDPTLKGVYHFILRECPEVDGERLIVGSMLWKAIRFWRVALRDLIREGALARRDTIFFYILGDLEPDWERIELSHQNALARLRKIVSYLEQTPALPLR